MPESVRVYIAGPMTGYYDNNFPAFSAEAARLRAMGYYVVNPAEVVADQGVPWHLCMRADIAALMTCTHIAMLPGWEKSRGATIERNLADELKIELLT